MIQEKSEARLGSAVFLSERSSASGRRRSGDLGPEAFRDITCPEAWEPRSARARPPRGWSARRLRRAPSELAPRRPRSRPRTRSRAKNSRSGQSRQAERRARATSRRRGERSGRYRATTEPGSIAIRPNGRKPIGTRSSEPSEDSWASDPRRRLQERLGRQEPQAKSRRARGELAKTAKRSRQSRARERKGNPWGGYLDQKNVAHYIARRNLREKLRRKRH